VKVTSIDKGKAKTAKKIIELSSQSLQSFKSDGSEMLGIDLKRPNPALLFIFLSPPGIVGRLFHKLEKYNIECWNF
jgi:hypothetical protein